jgi:hypothetical protein
VWLLGGVGFALPLGNVERLAVSCYRKRDGLLVSGVLPGLKISHCGRGGD